MEDNLSYVRERVNGIMQEKYEKLSAAMFEKAKSSYNAKMKAQEKKELEYLLTLKPEELVSAVYRNLASKHDRNWYYEDVSRANRMRAQPKTDGIMQKINTKFSKELEELEKLLNSLHNNRNNESARKIIDAKKNEVLDGLLLAKSKDLAKILADLVKWEPKV